MTEHHAWQKHVLGERAVEALRKHEFNAIFVQTAQEAVSYVASQLQPGMKVGFGGSMTLKALGMQQTVADAGCEVLDHNAPGLTPERKMEILRAQLTCDVFLSSSNAVTLEGELLNVDGNGNRVAALTFGPRKVIVVAGTNKIVRDLDEALSRIETTAAPLNNRRLDKPNPCTRTGECMDCDTPTRICRIYHILKRKPSLSDITVVIVGEDLGF